MKFTLTGSRVLDPSQNSDQVRDISWQEGVLGEPQSSLPLTAGAGWVSGPGLVDLYAHSGEPGYEQRETLASLVKAGYAGGFTQLTLLPDTCPALDQVSSLRLVQSMAPATLNVLGAMTKGCRGEHLVEFGEMADWVAGFTDNQPITNWQQLRHVLDYVRPFNKPIFVYPRDQRFQQGVAQESSLALALGLTTSPALAETSALETLLELVRLTGTQVHVMRLATAGGVALMRRAKDEGLPVTCSVTVAQLIHSEEELVTLDPLLRFEPPLGNKIDHQALLAGLRDGTIDAIATDHTPWTYAEKMVPFTQAPAGAIMLELALPLLWSQLVTPGHLEALTLWRALTMGPTEILRLPSNPSWITFDPEQAWQVSAETLHSLSTATPWLGKWLKGKVCGVWTMHRYIASTLE